jgi:hypothetical protein
VNYVNGKIPQGYLRDIPGGQLVKPAAASWIRLRRKIGKKEGVWIAPTSPRTAYRNYQQQVYFWNLYQSGKGALAARPGNSAHGWGLAVDVPTQIMAQAINKHGAEHGWQKKWSDAPSEWWHFRYDPNHDEHAGERYPVDEHDRDYLTEAEKHYRDTLVHERRVAKRNGGWQKVDASHIERAADAKQWLRERLQIISEKAKEDGWTRENRRQRSSYIKRLLRND